jgi:hypothetical protein
MLITSERKYRLTYTTEVLGTVPKDPEIYKTFIETKRPKDKEAENESENVEKAEEKGWTGFMKDEKGYFIYEYMFKGFFKSAADALAPQIKVAKTKKDGTQISEAIKAVDSKIDRFLFVSPRRIYFHKFEVDGVIERPLRGMTPKGPRVTLARSDCFNPGLQIEFALTLFPNKEITWEIIELWLEYGVFSGLGQFRNGGYGRFVVEKL